MKPILKYGGGKSKELKYFLKYIPEYDGYYFEPFFGGGALYFHLEPEYAFISDINQKLIDFYTFIQNNFNIVKKELEDLSVLYTINQKIYEHDKKLFPDEKCVNKNEELYYKMRDGFNNIKEIEYSSAATYFFINKTAFSGMIRYNSNGEFNVPFGHYKSFNPSSLTEQHENLLKRSYIFCCDYKPIFQMSSEDDFMFLDPPYDCVFNDYGNVEYKERGFGEKEHIELASEFEKLRCKALMIIGKTELTERLYKNYIIDEYDKNYSVNIRNRFKSSAKHLIITNYDIE